MTKVSAGKTLAATFFALVLMLGLAACGGADRHSFVGVWEIESMEGEEAVSDEDLAAVKDLGLNVYLTLWEDGQASLDYVGETLAGTWKEGSDGKAVLTTDDGSTADLALEDGRLKLSMSDVTMTFFKTHDTPGSVESATVEEEANGPEDEAEEASSGDDVSDVIDAVVGEPFGNEYVSITITQVGKSPYGDSGYEMTMENIWDGGLIVDQEEGTFTVDGVQHDIFIYTTLEEGETAEIFPFFDAEDITDPAELVNVEGTLRILDAETFDTLATMQIRFPAP